MSYLLISSEIRLVEDEEEEEEKEAVVEMVWWWVVFMFPTRIWDELSIDF